MNPITVFTSIVVPASDSNTFTSSKNTTDVNAGKNKHPTNQCCIM